MLKQDVRTAVTKETSFNCLNKQSLLLSHCYSMWIYSESLMDSGLLSPMDPKSPRALFFFAFNGMEETREEGEDTVTFSHLNL